MSEASSAVTYTDSEPGRVFWRVDEELSDGSSPRVIVYGFDGLPMMPVAPPSPDYIPGLEDPQTPPAPQDEDEHKLMFIQPHDPDFVPEPIYPEYIPLEDEHILPVEEQPLPPVVSPTAESPGYVTESDTEEDPEEYEEDEAKDGTVGYPMDGGDDRDDDDIDSSGYDADNEDEDEEEEEEEEYLASADFATVISIDELVAPSKGTKPTIPLPSTDTATIGVRITIRPQTSISLPPKVEIERLLAMSTPPPSPFTSLLPPFAGERLARCMAPAALPSPPLPPSSYPPPPVDRYGIRDTWIDPAEAVPEIASTTLEKVNTRVTELAELHELDTQDLYALLEDAQDSRTRISQRVAMDSQRVDLLMGDRMTLQEIVWIVKDEAYAAREAWAQLVGLNQTAHHELQTLRVQVYAHDYQLQAHQAQLQQIMAPITRQGQNPLPPNTNTPPHHMNPESVQAMIDQALLRNSTYEDGSQSSHEDNPRHKLEIELWNLKVKGNDVSTYTNRFQELTLICTKFVANKNEKIDKYISGLPYNIYGNVKSSKPRTLDKTIELKNDLMDQKLRTYAKRADNKRKTDDTSRNNHGNQQQPFKKQNVTKVYNMGTGERKPYEGSLPKCTKCQRHHNGPCTQKCYKCSKVWHFARDCRSSGNANVTNAQRDGKETPKGNGCFECGASGHFKRDYLKLKNKNGGNRNAQGWVYAVGNAEKNGNAPTNPDSNVVTELGSFDVIIGMDWLRRCHAVIVCDEKLVQIPYGNKTLTFRENKINNGRESRLAVISCSKAQEYMAKGCQIFLAHISAKKEEDKLGGKQLKDVPIIRDFPKVFPKDFPGLPPARPVKFQIDLIPGAAPVARAPYRLAPSEMKELSEQLQELFDKGFIRPISSPWGAPDEKEHGEHLKAILELLKGEKLYAKFSKCEVWIPK
nr:hypothetical protein [Tanacetum cinerariifolium]